MYGIIGSAVAVAMLSVALLKARRARTVRGDTIVIPPKEFGQKGCRYWMGGTLFGLGWALTGACPGPMFALIGSGEFVYAVALLSALLGTYAYGVLRHRLPH